MAKYDPLGADANVSINGLIRDIRMKKLVGESLHLYAHQVISKVKDLIIRYDVLVRINNNTALSKECANAVCAHFPASYGKDMLDEYLDAIQDKQHPVYKNFFEFLSRLLANSEGRSKIDTYSFKVKNESIKAEKLEVFATDTKDYKDQKKEKKTFWKDNRKIQAAFQQVIDNEIECWNCRKKGHTIRNCPDSLSEEKRKQIAKEKLKSFKKKAYKSVKKTFVPLKDQKDKLALKNAVYHLALNYVDAMLESSESDSTMGESSSSADSEDETDEVDQIMLANVNVGETKSVGMNKISTRKSQDEVKSDSLTEELAWIQNIPPDRVLSRREAAIFPNSETEKGLSVSIQSKYLGDCGCLGINLGGQELLDEIVQKGLPFEFRKIESVPVDCAWHAQAKIKHILKVTIVCSTVHGLPLIVDNVFLHIVNRKLGTIFLGTRFCKQVGLKTVNDQIDDEALKRHEQRISLSKAASEDSSSIVKALEGFTLDLQENTTSHCKVTENPEVSLNNVQWSEEWQKHYLGLIKKAVGTNASVA